MRLIDRLPRRKNKTAQAPFPQEAALPKDDTFIAQEPPAPQAPPRIRYLISPAGFPNYGDEFIARAWLLHLAQTEPQSEVWLDCIAPGHAALLFKDIHPRLHFVNTAWQLVWNAMERSEDYRQAVDFIDRWVHNLGSAREDMGIELMRTADSIHLLGGGYINESWFSHALLLRVARNAKQQHEGMHLMGTGLGLAPWSDTEDSRQKLDDLRVALADFDYLSVRDQASAQLLGLETGIDDAFLGLAIAPDTWQNVHPHGRLFVCLQGDVVGRHPESVSCILETLVRSGAEPSEPIALIESIPGEDAWCLPLVQQAWQGEVTLLPFLSLWKEGVPVAPDALWASTRFHMHLLAAASGARGTCIEYENDYYTIKHQSLRDLGTGWSLLDGCDDTHEQVLCQVDERFPRHAQELAQRKLLEAQQLYA